MRCGKGKKRCQLMRDISTFVGSQRIDQARQSANVSEAEVEPLTKCEVGLVIGGVDVSCCLPEAVKRPGL